MQSAQGHAICGAKTRSGAPCRSRPMPNGRCRMHGGTAPVSIASPHFQHGRRSKYLPARLLDRYHEAASDPDLLAVRDEIALLDMRLNELLEQVDTGEAGELWMTAQAAWLAYLRKRDTVQERDAQRLLDQIIERGATAFQSWAEIHQVIEQRRKLSETEQKRLVTMQQMVTVEQAMSFVAALQTSVRKHVTDTAALRAIAADMAMLANQNRQAA